MLLCYQFITHRKRSGMHPCFLGLLPQGLCSSIPDCTLSGPSALPLGGVGGRELTSAMLQPIHTLGISIGCWPNTRVQERGELSRKKELERKRTGVTVVYRWCLCDQQTTSADNSWRQIHLMLWENIESLNTCYLPRGLLWKVNLFLVCLFRREKWLRAQVLESISLSSEWGSATYLPCDLGQTTGFLCPAWFTSVKWKY